MKKLVFGSLVVVMAAGFLNGCGGGGGGGGTPPSTTDTTPPTVAAMAAATMSQTQIDLSWGTATDAGGLNASTPYRLFAAQGATPPASCSGTPIYQGTGTSYSNTGLTAGTQYSYRLCVFDAAGNSASTTASANTTSSTGSSAGSASISTPQPITTSAQAAKAADASVTIASQIASSGVTSLTSTVLKPAETAPASGRRVMDIVHSVMDKVNDTRSQKQSLAKVSPATTAINQTINCVDGGTYTLDMPAQTSNQVVMTITYTGCKENNSLQNGVFSISYTSDPTNPNNVTNAVFTMGSSPTSPYVETFYSGTTYSSVTEKNQQYLSMTFSSSGTTTSTTMSMSMNGYEEHYDYAGNKADKTEFSNFAFNATEDMTATGTNVSLDMTMSGAEKHSDYNGTVISAANLVAFEDSTFQNFRLLETSSANGEQISISGTMAYVSQPDCMSGTYTITTQTPITINSNGNVTAGQITVNGVVIVFNADGSITATLNGAPVTVSNYAGVCTL